MFTQTVVTFAVMLATLVVLVVQALHGAQWAADTLIAFAGAVLAFWGFSLHSDTPKAKTYMGTNPPAGLKIGSILYWKRGGNIAAVLSLLIKLCDPWARQNWDRWGWHLSFISGWDDKDGWLNTEASGDGDRTVPLKLLGGEYQVKNWFTVPLTQTEVDKFLDCHAADTGPLYTSKAQTVINRIKYDYFSYFWTAIYVLSGRRLPRLIDYRDNCWELVFDMAYWFHDPFTGQYQTPYLPTFLAAYQKRLAETIMIDRRKSKNHVITPAADNGVRL